LPDALCRDKIPLKANAPSTALFFLEPLFFTWHTRGGCVSFSKVVAHDPHCIRVPYLPHYCGVTYMNLELIGQLVSVALVVGAGPIIVAAVYARGGNL